MNANAALVIASVLLSAALPAQAVPYGVLLESNGDRGANNEVYALTYDQWTDALANNIATQSFTPLDINPLFGLTGFTFDGSVYRMLLESNGDRGANNEIYALTYNSWNDVLTNTIAEQYFLPLDINPVFSAAGLMYDGIAYRMLLESDADRGANNEIYALTYNTWADVLTNTISEQYFLPLDINPVFSMADVTWDGTAYRMLLESNADRGANNEIYALTYNSWADLVANNIGPQSFTPLDINPVFSIGGFGALAFPTTSEPPRNVPEPSTLALFVLGLAWLAKARRGLGAAPPAM